MKKITKWYLPNVQTHQQFLFLIIRPVLKFHLTHILRALNCGSHTFFLFLEIITHKLWYAPLFITAQFETVKKQLPSWLGGIVNIFILVGIILCVLSCPTPSYKFKLKPEVGTGSTSINWITSNFERISRMNSHKTALFWQYRTHFLHSEMVSNNYTIVSKSDEPLRLEELIGKFYW